MNIGSFGACCEDCRRLSSSSFSVDFFLRKRLPADALRSVNGSLDLERCRKRVAKDELREGLRCWPSWAGEDIAKEREEGRIQCLSFLYDTAGATQVPWDENWIGSRVSSEKEL